VQRHPVARSHLARHGFAANAGVPDFALGIVRIDPEDVQRNLAVDGDRLDSVNDRLAGPFQHGACFRLGYPFLGAYNRTGMRPYPSRVARWTVVVAVLAAAGTTVRGVPQASLPPGRDVIAAHVKAIGGAAALASISSMRARGRFEIPAQGISGDIEILSARPAKLLSRVTVPALGRIENGFDGTIGWSVSPISGPELLSGRQLAELADDASFDSHLHAADRVREITTLDKTEFDGRPAYRVKVVFVSGNEQVEYYDADAGWQIGSEASRATPQGIVPMTNVLRDYRREGPLMQPTTFIQRALGFEQRLTFSSFEYDVVPSSAFEPPVEVKALIGR